MFVRTSGKPQLVGIDTEQTRKRLGCCCNEDYMDIQRLQSSSLLTLHSTVDEGRINDHRKFSSKAQSQRKDSASRAYGACNLLRMHSVICQWLDLNNVVLTARIEDSEDKHAPDLTPEQLPTTTQRHD